MTITTEKQAFDIAADYEAYGASDLVQAANILGKIIRKGENTKGNATALAQYIGFKYPDADVSDAPNLKDGTLSTHMSVGRGMARILQGGLDIVADIGTKSKPDRVTAKDIAARIGKDASQVQRFYQKVNKYFPAKGLNIDKVDHSDKVTIEGLDTRNAFMQALFVLREYCDLEGHKPCLSYLSKAMQDEDCKAMAAIKWKRYQENEHKEQVAAMVEQFNNARKWLEENGFEFTPADKVAA